MLSLNLLPVHLTFRFGQFATKWIGISLWAVFIVANCLETVIYCTILYEMCCFVSIENKMIKQ